VTGRPGFPPSGSGTERLKVLAGYFTGPPQILHRVQRGDPQAAEELLPLVYDELRKLARVLCIC
jgi:hypothetical protein